MINTYQHIAKHRAAILLLSAFSFVGIRQVNAQSAIVTLSSPITTAQTVQATSRIILNPGFGADGTNGIVHLQIVSFPVSPCAPLASAASQNQNFVMTLTPRIPITDATTLLSKGVCEVNQTIEYFDALGRPIQTVQTKASPTLRDIVQPIGYDPYGRDATSYMPYTVLSTAASDGSFKTSGIADQASFYANPTDPATWNAPGVVQTQFPIAQTKFEPSPLDRIVEKGAAGDNWQPLGTPNAQNPGHTVRVVYATNNSTTVGTNYFARAYASNSTLNYDGQHYFLSNPVLTDLGNYGVGQLDVIITQDENWPTNPTYLQVGTTEEYKNKIGQTVLKRTYNFNTGTNALETLSTYYVYDYSGNLTFVLPPGANPDNGLTSASNQAQLDTWCYQYIYDGRNRFTKKKVPGKGWEYFVYNIQDQLIAVQDANQQVNNQWVFTKYDALGRIVKTGVWADNYTDQSPDYLQSQINTQSTIWESRAPGSDYTNLAWPTANAVDYTVNYYDNYNVPGIPAAYASSNATSMLHGLATASKTAVLNNPTDILWKVTYYNEKNQAIQTYQQHYLGGTANAGNYDAIINTYDFTDAIIATTRNHYTTANASAPTVTIANTYVYDHVGRKRQSFEQINSGTNTLIGQNDYNEVGQQLTKHLHSTDGGTTFLQDVAYTYNERGWLRTLSTNGNLFNMELKYNTAAIPQYNGNIGQMSYLTTHAANPGSRSFSYIYDAVNRLTNATFTGGQTGDALDETISYDVMGNITQLVRNGTGAGTLNYTSYTGSQLNTVTGYSARSYTYDPNGNATSDGMGKGITYNLLNLPQTVSNGTTTLATYIYDASGNKLRNTGSDGSWDYVSGIVYYTPIGGTRGISFIQTEEGRVAFNNGVYNYEYNLKDHLGNNRVSIDQYNGVARVIQEDEYYSFGLRKPTGGFHLSSDNRYLYNGKEIQTDLTNQYDYGNRFYDPIIARFSSVDAKADEERRMSDYSYAIDNPIRFVDLDGDGPGDRVKAALQMTGSPYVQETTIPLRTEVNSTALANKDCSEFVMRVLAADGITKTVESVPTSSMQGFFKDHNFAHSMTPQVGDVALWKGHTGIVGAVDKEGHIKLIAGRGAGKPAGENPDFAPPSAYRSAEFYGYYRPRPEDETPDGKNINVNGNTKSSSEKSSPKKSHAKKQGDPLFDFDSFESWIRLQMIFTEVQRQYENSQHKNATPLNLNDQNQN